MSFGKARLTRFGDTKEESAGSDHLKRTISRVSVVSQRPLKSPVPKHTPRSHSLNRSKPGTPLLRQVSTASEVRTKIPTQIPKVTGLLLNKDGAKQKLSAVRSTVDKNRLLKPPKSVISSVLSVPSTAPTKSIANHAILKGSPSKKVVGVRSSPNAAKKPSILSHPGTPIRNSPSCLPKPVLSLTKKENVSHKIEKREKTMVLDEKSNSVNASKSLEEYLPSPKEEVEESLRSISVIKKALQTDLSPSLMTNNMQIFESLLSVLSNESMSFCSQIEDNRVTLLANFINNKIELSDNNLQDEKIANYLEEGDGFHQKHDSLRISQMEATQQILTMAREIISENIALKALDKNLEQKSGLLEEENKDMIKQIKLFSEELETEKQKSSALNLRRTQLEQQLRRYSQRVKELEEKSQRNDDQISNQGIQLKSFETQLKQKEEKYHILEQRFNQQLKQYRAMVESREKLENQRESLEIRVNDLKKLKNNLQNEHINAMESMKKQLNEALKSLEAERIQRLNFEKELKETQERLVQVQEKSLELADVTEVSKAAIMSEGSLTASEKEANLFMKLKEMQANFEGATVKIEYLQEENEKLRTAVFQYMEQSESNKDTSESASLIAVLKSDLLSKEETIEKLQKQIADYLKGVKESENCIEELRQKRGESGKGGKGELTNAEEALWLEIHQLRQRLEDGKSLNENLQHQLAQKQLEVEQRERIMREQAKVLQVRDELLKLLRKKDQAKTGQMTALQAKLEDHERNADTVCKYFSAKSEQMQELYSTLEMKQRQVMQLEEQVKQLEVQEERGQCQRTRLEARIAELEFALHEKAYLPMACIPRDSKFRFI